MFEGVDVIPVVRGGGDYQRLFPPGIFIDAKNFPSPESLGKYLHQLGQDEKTYVSMLQKKSRYVHVILCVFFRREEKLSLIGNSKRKIKFVKDLGIKVTHFSSKGDKMTHM